MVQVKIAVAELAWAKLVQKLGISAVARELGVTPQSLSQKARRIIARAEEK